MRAVRGHHVKSSPYHPQRNGQAETTNKTPLKILSRMVYKEPKQWTCLYCGDVFEEWMVPAFERGPNGRARPLGHEPIRMPGWWLKRAFDGRRNPEERLECRIFWLILGRRAYYLNFFFFNMLGRLLSWLVHQSTLFITSFRNLVGALSGSPLSPDSHSAISFYGAACPTPWSQCVKVTAPPGCWAMPLPTSQEGLPLPRCSGEVSSPSSSSGEPKASRSIG